MAKEKFGIKNLISAIMYETRYNSCITEVKLLETEHSKACNCTHYTIGIHDGKDGDFIVRDYELVIADYHDSYELMLSSIKCTYSSLGDNHRAIPGYVINAVVSALKRANDEKELLHYKEEAKKFEKKAEAAATKKEEE